MHRKPTIQMIADMAGVSRGTVDRVLNNRSYVRQDVRERVLKVVQETGYISPKEALLRREDKALQPIRLGVLLPNFEHQFLDEVQQGIQSAREALKNVNVDILVRRCQSDLPGEAIQLLDELKGLGVMGLSVCALNDRTVAEHLAAFKSEGIPSITFNCDLPDSRRLLFVSQDDKQAGRLAAELMSKCLRPGEKLLATIGSNKYDGHRQRLLGFKERFFELGFSAADFLTAETFNDYNISFDVVKDAILRYPELRGVYMANLNVAGCTEAVRSAGKTGQIHVVCHDINPGIRQLLLDGLVDFTIPQDFIQQGYLPLVLMTSYLRTGRFPDHDSGRQPLQILCRENIG